MALECVDMDEELEDKLKTMQTNANTVRTTALNAEKELGKIVYAIQHSQWFQGARFSWALT